MKKAILATKVGMTQIFNEDGALIPVTVLQAGPCAVTQIKTEENDGYSAVQVGFVDEKEKMCFCLFDLKGIDVAIKFILISEKNTLNHSICLLGGGEGKRGSEKSANLLYKIRKH